MTISEQIACIVLNWNGGTTILECLRSIHASRNVVLQSIVVDNGSTDGSLEDIRVEFPDVRIVELAKNKGLAAARNIGVREALKGECGYILFIDDDARVEPDTICRLKEVLATVPDVGIVSPRILDGNTPEIIWYDGGMVNRFGDPVHRGMGKKAEPSTSVTDIEFATGCCVLIKQEVFSRVGMLDEEFFVYSEDTDFSFRARSSGHRIIHVPSATVLHDQSSDTTANRGKWYRDYYVTRNKLLLFKKHYRGLAWVTAIGYFKIRHGIIPALYFMLTLQPSRLLAVARGVLDHLRGRYGERFR